jgi:hypothetical protein
MGHFCASQGWWLESRFSGEVIAKPGGGNMTILRKTTLTSFLLGSCLFGGVVSLQADHRSDCEKHIQKAENNLYKEIRKHGEHSRQAENRRRELEQARYGCREVAHHRYYDRSRYGSYDRDRDRYYRYYDRDRYRYYDRDRDRYYRYYYRRY